MTNISYFKIFNSSGNPLNYRVEGDNIIVPLNISKVSTALISTETIYVLEEVWDGSKFTLDSPLVDGTEISYTKNEERFFPFHIDGEDIVVDQIDANVQSFIGNTNQTYNNDRRINNSPSAKPMVLNIGFTSKDEGNYTGDIVFDLDGTKKLIFECYSEAEAQDHRMIDLLHRFGEKVGVEEERIFRETDLNNDIQDNLVLNNKRKEYLNLISELQVYFPTIRGYDVVLYYFGWRDLVEVKEYYYDPEVDKNRTFELSESSAAKDNLVKLKSFGLFYKINVVKWDETDENGNPVTEDVIQLPQEELAIKMFFLKRFLESRGIGGISNIIDIIGEQTNFTKLKIRNWNNKSDYLNVSKDVVPTIDIVESTGYLKDVREYDNLNCPYLPDDDLSQITVTQLAQCTITSLTTSFAEESYDIDSPFLKIGSLLRVRNSTFDVSWEQALVPWIIDNAPQNPTWENLGGLNYYEATMIIKSERGFEHIEILPISSINEVRITLPHLGFYDITIILKGFNGRYDRRKFEKAVFVDSRKIELLNFLRIHNRDLQVWQTCYLAWEDITSNWGDVVYDNTNQDISRVDFASGIFDIVNYVESYRLEGYRELSYLDYELLSWEDLKLLSWSDVTYDIPDLPSGIIQGVVPDTNIFIGGDIYLFDPNINPTNFYALAEDLESQFVDGFLFTKRTDFANMDFIECMPRIFKSDSDFYMGSDDINNQFSAFYELNSFNSFIVGAGLWGEWNDLEMPWEETEKLFRSKSINEPFTTENIKFSYNTINVPKTIPMFISTEVSKIMGKEITNIEIVDSEDKIVRTITDSNGACRFFENGLYSVRINIKDNEGNEYQTFRNNIINVVDHSEYTVEV